jgi:hypothetical protein
LSCRWWSNAWTRPGLCWQARRSARWRLGLGCIGGRCIAGWRGISLSGLAGLRIVRTHAEDVPNFEAENASMMAPVMAASSDSSRTLCQGQVPNSRRAGRRRRRRDRAPTAVHGLAEGDQPTGTQHPRGLKQPPLGREPDGVQDDPGTSHAAAPGNGYPVLSYSEAASTPISRASRRIVTASMPSLSAMASASCSVRDRCSGALFATSAGLRPTAFRLSGWFLWDVSVSDPRQTNDVRVASYV